MATKNKKVVTIVGARKCPKAGLEEIGKIASELAAAGYTLRSGAAPGCDQMAELKFREHHAAASSDPEPFMEIFLPWKGFEGSNSELFGAPDEAFEMAAEVHPKWDSVSPGAQKLHARNVGQVLGRDLKSPSNFLIFWSEPNKFDGGIDGGTRTAVELAKKNNVPVYNVFTHTLSLSKKGEIVATPKEVKAAPVYTTPEVDDSSEEIPF